MQQIQITVPQAIPPDRQLLVAAPGGQQVSVKVPAGTQPGTTMRIEGKGAPKLNNLNLRGTHFVKVNVQIPRSLSTKEKDLVTQLKSVSS